MSDFEFLQHADLVRQGETIPPLFKRDAFHCIFCLVFARQGWRNLKDQKHMPETVAHVGSRIWICKCSNCRCESYWLADQSNEKDSRLVFPARAHGAPAPHVDLPPDVRADYEEAASILDRSPRGATALLRLALQKLMPHLGEKGKNIYDDIKSLVAKGLDPGIQQALDALRVIGNNAVHPGELDLRDDRDTAAALFGLINYIVDQRITHPQKLQQLYDRLPEKARTQIEQRDKV